MLFFLYEIVDICVSEWKVCLVLVDLFDCCVEIIGLVDCKMVVNVFNFGVKCFMVDFEDVMVLLWINLIEG